MGAPRAYGIGLLTVRLQLILDADLVPPEIAHVVFVDELGSLAKPLPRLILSQTFDELPEHGVAHGD